MHTATTLVQLSQVSVVENQRTLISNIDLSIADGEIITIIGPNGAGKTTLIKTVLGLIKPSQGSVVKKPGLSIGYMPQTLKLDNSIPLTVKRFLKNARYAKPSALDKAVAETDIASLLEKPVQSLSGGETQRVMLARALLQQPQLLVLDEPVQGVDISGQAELYQLIGGIRDIYSCSIIMVSHDLHLVMSATDKVICLNRHVCCSGHPEQITSDPAYLALFQQPGSEALAVYTHHHDHKHDASGNIVDNHRPKSDD